MKITSKKTFFKLIFFVLTAVIFLNSIKALDAENANFTDACIDYSIFDKKALVEASFKIDSFFLETPGTDKTLKLKLPYDARTIELKSNAEIKYNISETIESKTLIILFPKLSNLSDISINVSYFTNSVIDKSSRNYFFILKNSFRNPICLRVHLPEGGFLEDIVVPDPDSITTDGRIISLIWNNFSSEEVILSYNFEKSFSFWVVLLSLVLFLIVVYQFFLLKKRVMKAKRKNIPKKKKRALIEKSLTKNLFGEEKEIIKYLLNKKRRESWTKEIVKDLGINKVRLSRKLRNLQQRGLIEKIPYGNENRIRLIKRK